VVSVRPRRSRSTLLSISGVNPIPGGRAMRAVLTNATPRHPASHVRHGLGGCLTGFTSATTVTSCSERFVGVLYGPGDGSEHRAFQRGSLI